MTTKRMAKLKECVLHLANSITKYSEYLDTQNKRMMEIHNLPHPVRTPGDGISTSPRSIKSQNLLEKYSDIQYSSSIQCVKKVRSRLLAAIDSQDTNVVFYIRNLAHEEDETKFDDFFNEVEKMN